MIDIVKGLLQCFTVDRGTCPSISKTKMMLKLECVYDKACRVLHKKTSKTFELSLRRGLSELYYQFLQKMKILVRPKESKRKQKHKIYFKSYYLCW